MAMSNAVTMKVVAAHAGVTQATVSLCLANSPLIPAATRLRIQHVAQALGYRPNPYVSALMRARRLSRGPAGRPVLALINAFARPDGWRGSPAHTVRQMRTGAEARGLERGYSVQEFWLHQDGMTNERFSTMLYARGIQGLILGPVAEDAPPPQLHWPHFAAVSLSVPMVASTMHTVCNDHYFSVLHALRECHALGYRRPGLIIRRAHRNRFQGRWEAGFLMGRHLLPGVHPTKPLYVEDWDQPAAVCSWLRQQAPDVIISPGAEPLSVLLRAQGWDIPRQLGLAGLACSAPDHPVTGVYQNGHLIGATAVDALISILERNERGLPAQAMTQMIEGLWNPGTTLRTQATGKAKTTKAGAPAGTPADSPTHSAKLDSDLSGRRYRRPVAKSRL